MAKLSEHGLKMPKPLPKPTVQHTKRIPDPIPAPSDSTASDDGEQFKESIMENVESVLPKALKSSYARTMASALLKDSLKGVRLSPGQDRVAMGTALVCGMVKELGLDRQQVEQFIAQIENESGDNGLRTTVLTALDKDDDRDQDQCVDGK